MDYYEWNFNLTKHYFNNEMAGREVRLFVDESVINNIGKPYNTGFTDFITAVKIGPGDTTRSGICMKAYQIYNNWRKIRKYPPYIAYLVLFVLAAGTDGDWSPIAYYPRLNTLLGEPENSSMPASFQKMQELWLDLEKWSKEDRLEQLGRFSVKIYGPWIHVGLPQSQTLLSIKERKLLSQFFYNNSYDPLSPPGENTILKALINSNIILSRTRALLVDNSNGKQHLRESLAGFVIDELKQWDGTVVNEESGGPETRVRGSVKICLTYDSFAGIVSTTVRVKVNSTFPEDDIILKDPDTGNTWICAEAKENWSKELRYVSNKQYLDAKELDWVKGCTLIEEETGWKVKLTSASIRVFASGTGFSQWIEVSKINSGCSYYLACVNGLRQSILEWGKASCNNFAEITSTGLPEGWSLFKVDNIIESHPEFEILQLSRIYSFGFSGGIKTGRGNTYFNFAQPKIFTEGVDSMPNVMGQQLEKSDDDLWILPDGIPLGIKISVELEFHEKIIKQYFKLTLPERQRTYNSPFRDQFGVLCSLSDVNRVISGAVICQEATINIPEYPFEIPAYLSRRIIFVGLQPGQIADWPNKEIPKDWKPIWAIVKLKRDSWKAYYIGENLEYTIECKTKLQNWKKWKRAFTGLGALPPDVETHRHLWELHRKEAVKL